MKYIFIIMRKIYILSFSYETVILYVNEDQPKTSENQRFPFSLPFSLFVLLRKFLFIRFNLKSEHKNSEEIISF